MDSGTSIRRCVAGGRLASVLLAAVLAAGCAAEPLPAATTVVATETSATTTPVPPSPDATAAAFLDAWQRADYALMYSSVSPDVAAAMDFDSFHQRYAGALSAANVVTVTTRLVSVLEEGDRASAAFHLELATPLMGSLITDTLMSLSLHGRQWYVDWTEGLIWPGLSGGHYFRMDYAIPVRANVYDRSGLGLATEGTIVTVGVIPGEISDETALLGVLSQVTRLSVDEIRGRYATAPADWRVPIADIPAEVSVENNDLLTSVSGVFRDEKDGRTYPVGGAAPHVVGWVAPVPAERLDAYRSKGYRGDERVGVAGIEQWGEGYLSGQHGGTLSVVDASGQETVKLAERPAEPGRAVFLTLDREFQRKVQEIMGGRRGAAVVLDVWSGAVVALVSSPGFDSNVFIGPAGEVGRAQVFADARNPLFNRATLGTYPSASVFKIVTMSAALENAGMHPDHTVFYCPGYWEGLGPAARKTCWKADGHGNITLRDALTASCDVSFYAVGQTLDGVGPEVLPAMARAFGFGGKTGLEGVLEDSGLVPDPDWKQSAVNDAWRVGDTVNLAIGQGYLLVTPLQVARMMAAVANGGTLYRPYVVQSIQGGETVPETRIEAEVVGRLAVSPEHLAAIQDALLGVTTKAIGTAPHRFTGLDIPVAGKTGTAEVGGPDSIPHSWFAAYAPANAPEIAIVVIAENAGEGTTVAAPLVRQIVEAYYGLPLTPLPAQAEEGYVAPTPTPEQ